MIIMLTGKAGCGKDTYYTCAKSLTANYPCTLRRFAFAENVKQIAQLYGWDNKKNGKGRKLLQSVGAVGREYNAETWIKPVLKNIKELPRDVIPIITDLRFANEYTELRKAFSETIYVVHIVGKQSDLGKNAEDISEAGVTEEGLNTKFITVHNDGDLPSYIQNIKHSLQDMGVIL